MEAKPNPEINTQVTETNAAVSGKSRGRLKPRHLSSILRQVIIDQFRACHSSEDVAEVLRIPVRTVNDVLLVEALRRPPQPERGGPMSLLSRRQSA